MQTENNNPTTQDLIRQDCEEEARIERLERQAERRAREQDDSWTFGERG